MSCRRSGLFAVFAVLVVTGCERSPTEPPSHETAQPISAAQNPDLPWIELDALRFRGLDETGQTSVDLTVEEIRVRVWPNPEFDPGPNWNPPVRWLQFLDAGAPGSDANAIDGEGRIQATPAGVLGLGSVSAFVIGTLTTPNGPQRITGTLTFDLSTAPIEPIKGGSFFESCGILCIQFGLIPRLIPDPGYGIPPLDLVGRLGLRPRPAFTTLSAGETFTCALTTDGAAYCWGDNDAGQLGDGTTTGALTPVVVIGGHTFTAISAGARHACGLTGAGAAYCWGRNTSGQLGDGTTADRSTPVPVAGGIVFDAISAGASFTCGVTAGTGAAYCWGSNSVGQLGDGTTTSRPVPVAVSGGLVFDRISAGGGHACGLTFAGTAYCWGSGQDGQLGDGTGTSRTAPVAVAGSHVYADVSAGGFHTCAINTAGDAYCWGRNEWGQLGDGGFDENQPIPVLVASIFLNEGITAGEDMSCAWSPERQAACWGRNHLGELGNGRTDAGINGFPGFVWNSRGTADTDFALVSAGNNHACALTSAGAAYCWGGNDGLLGDGTRTDSSFPVPVSPF